MIYPVTEADNQLPELPEATIRDVTWNYTSVAFQIFKAYL